MHVSDIELLPLCASSVLGQIQHLENDARSQLQTSAQTSLVLTLKLSRLHRSMLAIGMFSLFESLLQSEIGWADPFNELPEKLRGWENNTLAQVFCDYKSAINVLKHGYGRSYDRLLTRLDQLEFAVKPKGEEFFFEGDVSEPAGFLIDVDEKFVVRCAELIKEISETISSKEQDWH